MLALCNISEKRIEKVVLLDQERIFLLLLIYLDGCDKIIVDVSSGFLYISSLVGSVFQYSFPGIKWYLVI